jgi:predicted transcriptional regulator
LSKAVYIGKELRELQEALRISQEEMALALNIGQGTLSKYMNDRVPTPFEFVIIIPQKIKSQQAKWVVLEWRKKFDEAFWNALAG